MSEDVQAKTLAHFSTLQKHSLFKLLIFELAKKQCLFLLEMLLHKQVLLSFHCYNHEQFQTERNSIAQRFPNPSVFTDHLGILLISGFWFWQIRGGAGILKFQAPSPGCWGCRLLNPTLMNTQSRGHPPAAPIVNLFYVCFIYLFPLFS